MKRERTKKKAEEKEKMKEVSDKISRSKTATMKIPGDERNTSIDVPPENDTSYNLIKGGING